MKMRDLFALSRFRNSKPLYGLTLGSLVSAVIVVPFLIFDQRQLGMFSIWEKPLKFFISTAIFSITYSWLSSFISRGQSWIARLGWILTIAFVIELILITGVAATGQQSHFNVSNPLAITIWSVMATMISIALLCTVALSVLILFEYKQPLLLRLSLGLGSINTTIGMALAFLMTGPTSEQLSNFQGIAGSHSVGTTDGGPGIPFLGWSVIGGDLRVGHFFGLHSIQIAMLLLIAQFALPTVAKLPFIVLGNATYLGIVLTLTWQALRGESVVNPSPLTLSTLAGIAMIATFIFIMWVAARNRASDKSNETQQTKIGQNNQAKDMT